MFLVALTLCTLSLGCAERPAKVQRFGQVIGVKKECIPQYKKLHAACWPGVLKMLKECNLRNYSIWLAEVKPGEFYLFAYFEYAGDDFAKDMEKLKANPAVQEWWKHTDPMQYKLLTAGQDERWHNLEEVFYMP
jgi:L-rhamnose mutarotase